MADYREPDYMKEMEAMVTRACGIPGTFRLDSDPSVGEFTAAEFVQDNVDGFDMDDVEDLAALKVGDTISYGGGAMAESVVRRVSKSTSYQAFCTVCCGGGKFLGQPSSKKLAQREATSHINVYGHNVYISHK